MKGPLTQSFNKFWNFQNQIRTDKVTEFLVFLLSERLLKPKNTIVNPPPNTYRYIHWSAVSTSTYIITNLIQNFEFTMCNFKILIRLQALLAQPQSKCPFLFKSRDQSKIFKNAKEAKILMKNWQRYRVVIQAWIRAFLLNLGFFLGFRARCNSKKYHNT
jgi:hypothetical protein